MDFVDLYAGAGGWSLGLELAGHRSAFSGEIWPTANAARAWNLGGRDGRVDVRALDPETVPEVDLLVGSPPCTQFSWANRGGNGDLADGLVDIRAFLRIVRAKRPRHWVMENVPRLCSILGTELAPGGALAEFSDLFASIDDFDMSDWGVPQRRRRCIAGNYPREALLALRGRVRAPSLGEVVEGCRTGRDAVWGSLHETVTDNEPGDFLSWEEARINREKKSNHPIYNDMAFPDDPSRPARTVTATCTKVSRESIVVERPDGGYRLLSVRETAAIQSFPLSYQFPSRGRGDRIKMAGNAIPPLFTYMVGIAVSGADFSLPASAFEPASGYAPPAAVPRKPQHAPRSRSFRAAIDGLRFKSGMSFELRNRIGPDGASWEIVLNLGKFGDTHRVLDAVGIARAAQVWGIAAASPVSARAIAAMQAAWDSSVDCGSHPYRVADAVGDAAVALSRELSPEAAAGSCEAAFGVVGLGLTGKARRHAPRIAAGIAVASAFNAAAAFPRAAAA